MFDRRIELRMLCADLVDLQWKDKGGRTRRSIANLEDISASGACLQVERPIPLGTIVRVTYPKGELICRIKYCVFREIGYFLGVEFEDGSKWIEREFKPQHMLDPSKLINKTAGRKPAATQPSRPAAH